jgi:5-(aminomethyl)-3-furanmethanol phosphate kinase
MVVVKIGGGLLARRETFTAVLAEIAAASEDNPLLIVPGGGPFADAVREIDRRHGLTDDAAHWMAVLAMDQYAHAIASRLPNGKIVARPDEIEAALAGGQIPVLAPYQWMRDADPLPHSWDVTSDSISVWVATQVGAARLVLVKPPGASGPSVVDRSFDDLRPAHIRTEIVAADRLDTLASALRASD